jgi:hypothetical protein
MRDNLRSRKLLGAQSNDMMRHWLTIAENVCGHCRGRHGFVCVMNIIDVRRIYDVCYVCDTNIGYVHLLDVSAAVVIPGEKRVRRP